MMLKYLFALVLVVVALPSWSQVPDYDYFPPTLCKAAGLKLVTVYETKIDDPIANAGPANRIRLARNIVRQVYFDQTGNRIRSLKLARGGDIIEQELVFVNDGNGRKIRENLRLFHTNNADSTKLVQNRETQFAYDHHNKLHSQTTFLTSETGRFPSDSVAYHHDLTGRLHKEIVYDLSATPIVLLEKEYHYDPGKVEVITKIGGQTGNRDEHELDSEGRKVHERNFGPGDTQPRLESFYSYDPRGWLQEVRYVPDWKYFKRDETVVSRKNKFDDHGKLVEAQFDYGDGKRLVEFYDHSYWTED